MNVTRWSALALSLLFLTACLGGGGGGGGGGSSPSSPELKIGPSDAFTLDSSGLHDTTSQAARSVPAFGSVTQSSNHGVSGVTTDAASTTFDGTNVSLTVTREDGSSLALDSSAHEYEKGYSNPGIIGYSGRSHTLLDFTNNSLSAANVAVIWENDDPLDYLAGGYWLHLEGNVGTGRITGVEVGAFADGPELSGASPVIPILGTARYQGAGGGLYAYEFGSQQGEVPRGSVEFGEFSGTTTLTADFDARTISGCIGCPGGLSGDAILVLPNGESRGFSGNVSARIDLGAASFDSGGRFTSQDVEVVILGTDVTSTTGSWGGQFSNIPDASGDPRLVAGTAGAEWTESDGSEGGFVGAYYGFKQ